MMASMAQSPATLNQNLATKHTASDLLSSSSGGAYGVPLRALARARLGMERRGLIITSKARKVKRYEYPWPRDPDPNVEGGVLRHLSHFKPLKEKPKPVILEFEKPLMDLQKKIIDVQKMANETGLDFNDQIISLENKYQQALKKLYTHLTPIQRVQIARHPNRPTSLDHIFNITEKFVELHGDREGYDDPAIVTGLGTINDRSYMFIGQQKGRNSKENMQRNFGMPTPHGYRKALRMMEYADHHGFPIITLVDTPGAHADLKSEALNQGEAIAYNLRTMFGLKVPIVSIIIGEGGSGGALAIACANKLLMLENSVLYVASPEACAAILYKTAKAAGRAARKLKITSRELIKLQIADGIIPEPLGGAHTDPYWTSQQIKAAIVKSMDELLKMDTETLLKHRAQKFRKIGARQGEVPMDRMRMIKMKKKQDSMASFKKTSEVELRDEVEKMKQKILEAGKSATGRPLEGLKELVEKLKKELDYEYHEAVRALGMQEKILKLQEEVEKGRNAKDGRAQSALKRKIEQLKDEINRNLPRAPNYPNVKSKLDMLKELFKSLDQSKKSTNREELKLEINRRFSEIIERRPDIMQKIEALKADTAKAEASGLGSDPELEERVLQLQKELGSEFEGILKSLGLEVVPPDPIAKTTVGAFNEEVNMMIDGVVNSSYLKDKIEMLKAMEAKAGSKPDKKATIKIEALKTEIKQGIQKAINSPELKEKHEKLVAKILEAKKSLVETTTEDESTLTESQVNSRVQTEAALSDEKLGTAVKAVKT